MMAAAAVSAARTSGIAPIFVNDGLVMWLDATDTSTMTLTGTRLDRWDDKEGSGRFVQTTTSGTSFNPTYSSTGFGGIGSVVFSTKYLETSAAFTELNWTTGFTCLVAWKKTGRAGFYVVNIAGQGQLMANGYAERHGIQAVATSKTGINRDEPCVSGLWKSGATYKTIFDGTMDDLAWGTGTNYTGVATGKLQIGGRLASGPTVSEWAGCFIYNKALTAEQIEAMNAWIKEYYGFADPPNPTWNVVIDGNSLAIGTQGTSVSATYDGFLAANGSPKSRDCYLMARSGITTPNMAADAATRVDTLYNSSITATKRIVIVWEIGNDLGLNSTRTDTEAYNNIKSYCQARKAVGWKVIVATALPRTSSVNANYETYRLSVNSQVVANAVAEGWADAVADVASNATIGATGTSTNTTYYAADGIHLIDAGYTVAKTYFTNAINAVSGL
jgi:lysophospholipase L1-like esterase